MPFWFHSFMRLHRILAKILYFVQLVWNWFSTCKWIWMTEKMFRNVFDSECPNGIIYQLYVSDIIDIWLWSSVLLPITKVWHWHSLFAQLSSNFRAWDMWACSPSLSLNMSSISYHKTWLLLVWVLWPLVTQKLYLI